MFQFRYGAWPPQLQTPGARHRKQPVTIKGERTIKEYLQLIMAFFRVGMLGFGGGPSSIPLIHKEVVKKYKWMTDEEFSDLLALANTLPGPVGTKMPGYIGWQVKGVTGMIISVIVVSLPTILLMIFLLTFLTSFQDKPWVKGMTRAVVPVVGVMLGILTWQFFAKSKQGLGWIISLSLTFLSLILMHWLNIHPAIIIGTILILSLTIPVKTGRFTKKKERTHK